LWRLHRTTISPATKCFRQGSGRQWARRKIFSRLPHEAGNKRSQIASVEGLVISRWSCVEWREKEDAYQLKALIFSSLLTYFFSSCFQFILRIIKINLFRYMTLWP
jgi:hypothetical protein